MYEGILEFKIKRKKNGEYACAILIGSDLHHLTSSFINIRSL